MQPTRIAPTSLGFGAGSTTGSLPVVATATPLALPVALVTPDNFPITLSDEQVADLLVRVEEFDFAGMPAEKMARLGTEPTETLNRTLGAYLDRVQKNENPQLFKLIDSVTEAVSAEKLDELATQLQSPKLGLMDRIMGSLSKKALQRSLDQAYEEVGRLARNKSKSLSDVINEKERTLQVEMAKLSDELRRMDSLRGDLGRSFMAFGEEVVFLKSALSKAQAQAPALKAAAGHNTMVTQDIDDKLQVLESVAISRETMMTRLPAEALVIRQLQNAGVNTLLELSVTSGDGFAGIRMTLLSIHAANMVGSVQRLGQANATLGSNLQRIRATVAGAVVEEAANAPGRNRLAQAQDLMKVVADTANLKTIVENAKVENAAKNAEAVALLSQARQTLAS